ncbi:hypothetical protein HMPREF1545_00932 [Oscillibacter sp. KLE 1728]|jgi:hypothetical protein|nr:hypothetical protein HMPREF1545_00932 [Oscillibacter sp. KLE 1728]ERK67482.1 hypothetical protein HMPREF1546_00431 [Oscillibacter sp. KLE 1745]
MLNIVLARYGYSCRTAPSSSLTGKGKFQYTSLALIFGCDFLPVGTVISSSGHTLAVCKIRHFIYPQKLLTQIIGMLMCDRAIVDLRDVDASVQFFPQTVPQRGTLRKAFFVCVQIMLKIRLEPIIPRSIPTGLLSTPCLPPLRGYAFVPTYLSWKRPSLWICMLYFTTLPLVGVKQLLLKVPIGELRLDLPDAIPVERRRLYIIPKTNVSTSGGLWHDVLLDRRSWTILLWQGGHRIF